MREYRFNLEGDGDFGSDECLDFLNCSDIVCTNPPFSKFKTHMMVTLERERSCVVLGGVSQLTTRYIAEAVTQGRLWMGHNLMKGAIYLEIPDYYEMRDKAQYKMIDGRRHVRVSMARWYTNIDYPERHVPMDLYEGWTISDYPRYDSYDAIRVPSYNNIPKGYDGVVSVPISFIQRWCPEQFEILGTTRYQKGRVKANDIHYINGKCQFQHYLIKVRGVKQ